MTLTRIAQVGRAHGVDGSFWVEGRVEEGATVHGRPIERIGGTDDRPLARLPGVEDREAAAALAGEPVMAETELEQDEWLVSDLIGAEVVGVGYVERVIDSPSCDLLEVGDVLIPFIKDAIKSIGNGRIEVDLEFLGLTPNA